MTPPKVKQDCAHERTEGKPKYDGGTALHPGPFLGSVHRCLECGAERHYDKDSNVTKEWAKP